MPAIFRDLKFWLRAQLGDREDAADTVKGLVGQMTSRTIDYEWPQRDLVLASLKNYVGQTVSFSASQPILERTVFVADKECVVTEIALQLFVSATITNTASNSFHCVVLRRGANNGTYSQSYSVSTWIGGLTTDTGKHATASQSFSSLLKNVAHAPNRFHLNPNLDKRRLKRGAVLRAVIRKGSGTATDTGAIFRGGRLQIRVEED